MPKLTLKKLSSLEQQKAWSQIAIFLTLVTQRDIQLNEKTLKTLCQLVNKIVDEAYPDVSFSFDLNGWVARYFFDHYETPKQIGLINAIEVHRAYQKELHLMQQFQLQDPNIAQLDLLNHIKQISLPNQLAELKKRETPELQKWFKEAKLDLVQPALLVDQTEYKKWQQKKVLLTQKHSMFKPLQQMIKNIHELKNKIKENNIVKHLSTYQKIYEDYLNGFDSSPIEVQDLLLKPLAQLRGIGSLERWLMPAVAEKMLFAPKEISTGTHIVVRIGNNFYKRNPKGPAQKLLTSTYGSSNLIPGIEHAAASWYALMAGQGAAPTTILKINYLGESYFVQAAKAIEGTLLLKYLDQHKTPSFTNYSAIFVSNLIFRPGDGKPDNYMVAFQPSLILVGIDNDFAFVHSIYQSNKNHYVGLYDTVFALPQKTEMLNADFRKHFLSQFPEEWLMRWVQAVYQQSRYYELLKSQGILTEDEMKVLGLPPRFLEKELIKLYQRLCLIYNAIATDEKITHVALFKLVEPIISEYYQKILAQQGDLISGMEALHHGAPSIEELLPHVKIPSAPSGPWHFSEQRTQTILAELTTWLQTFDFKSIPFNRQSILLDRIRDFHELTELTFRESVALNDNYLQRLFDHFPHLTRITFIRCGAITETGLIALLNRAEPLYLKMSSCAQIDAAQWTTLYRYIQMYGHRIQIQMPNGFEFMLNLNEPTILHQLIERDREISQKPQRLQFFIDEGINLNHQDQYGRTALHLAAKHGYLNIVELLIESGASIHIEDREEKNKSKETPLQKALAYLQAQVNKGYPDPQYACQLTSVVLRLALESELSIQKNGELYLACKSVLDKFVDQKFDVDQLKSMLFHFLMKTKNANFKDHLVWLKNVTHLNLYGNQLSFDDLKLILENAPRLRELNLAGCHQLTDKHWSAIIKYPIHTIVIDEIQNKKINEAQNSNKQEIEETYTRILVQENQPKNLAIQRQKKETLFTNPLVKSCPFLFFDSVPETLTEKNNLANPKPF